MKTKVKHTKKRIYYVPITKLTITIVFLLHVMVIAPMTMSWALKHPIRATYYLARIGIGVNNTKNRAIRAVEKKIPIGVKKVYRRTGLKYAHKMTQEVSGQNIGAPGDTWYEKLGGMAGKGIQIVTSIF